MSKISKILSERFQIEIENGWNVLKKYFAFCFIDIQPELCSSRLKTLLIPTV